MRPRTIRLLSAFTLGALLSLRAAGDAAALDPRIDAAVQVYRQDGAEEALPLFERLPGQLGKAASTRDQAAVLHYTGECHWRLGEFREARDFLDRALALERRTADRPGQARTLNVLGLLAWDQGEYDEAIDRFKTARTIARALGDPKLEGASLNNLSLVYDELGDYDVSLKQYQQVLDLYKSVDFPRGVGDTLGNIGGVYLLLGQFREALGYYQQALAISERLKSTTSMSQDNGNLALCLLGLGETYDAIRHFDRAIDLAKEAGMREDQAYWMRQKGNGLIREGLYDQGLQSHRAALAVYESLGAQAELAEALHDSGDLYLLLGDTESAEQSFTRALALAREVSLARGITQNLSALGDLEFRRKRYDNAVGLYEQANQRSAASGERQLQAQSLLRLAQVHREQSKLPLAAAEADQALTIARDTGAHPTEAQALLSRAETKRRLDQSSQALIDFKAAEAALGPTRDPDLLWRILYGRARAQESTGDTRAALASLVAAVTVIESVRDQLQEPRFRAGFVDDKYDVYVELVRLQLQLGLTAEAFSTAERLRARSYAEQLGGRSPLLLTDVDRRRETQLRERIAQLQRALVDEDAEGAPAHSQRAMNRFSEELQRAEQEYQAFLDDHAAAPTPSVAAIAGSSVAALQALLQPDEALIEYVVGPDRLTAFVVTARGIAASTTPVRLVDLEARIALLRDLVQRPGDDRWQKPAASLAATLLQPLNDSAQFGGIARLYIVPHGVLNSLPFALLPVGAADDHTLLIDRYALAYLPAAAALRPDEPIAPDARSLLAMAPVRSRLRYAPEEARSIDALYAPHSRLLIGTGATESQFKKLAGGYNVVHLATHGVFNKANPLLSGIELEADAQNDGLLQVHEVLGLHLRASLVTLSACETALGSGYFSETPAGDEFVGMTRAFLAAGTNSVLATLWDVDDHASVTVMQRFYERLKQSRDGAAAATALAEAQRQLRASKDLNHPYYWAPLVMVGSTSRTDRPAELTAGRSP
jgi:CHAT domain-containing protein